MSLRGKLLFCYLIIGLLTFGYLQNIFVDRNYNIVEDNIIEAHFISVMPALMGGISWPFVLLVIIADYDNPPLKLKFQ